jgi:hypothetical protein
MDMSNNNKNTQFTPKKVTIDINNSLSSKKVSTVIDNSLLFN